MARQLSVSEVARRLGVRPRDISDLFYQRELRDDLCPIVAGRRLIPESYVTTIVDALQRAGGLTKGLSAGQAPDDGPDQDPGGRK